MPDDCSQRRCSCCGRKFDARVERGKEMLDTRERRICERCALRVSQVNVWGPVRTR